MSKTITIHPKIRYKELVAWRTICEYLNSVKGNKLANCEPGSTIPELKNLPSYEHFWKLLGFKSDRRDALWAFHNCKISFVRWDGRFKHWQLRSDWDEKIEWLEKVILLGDDPDVLPKPWIERMQQKEKERKLELLYSSLGSKYSNLVQCLGYLENAEKEDPKRVKSWVSWIRDYISESRKLIKSIKNELPPPKIVTDAVLSSPPKSPPYSAVLGGNLHLKYLIKTNPRQAISSPIAKERFLEIRQMFLGKILGERLPFVFLNKKFLLSSNFCNLNYINIWAYGSWIGTIRKNGTCLAGKLLAENLEDFFAICQTIESDRKTS